MTTERPKVMIIGLDSGCWEVLEPYIEAGAMPVLQRIREAGCSGVLHSTQPPMTPPAWTTLMTGVLPGKHGILAFEEYDPRTNMFRYTGSESIRVETMWQTLSRLGYRVASLNLPMTYPPMAVNGTMVSGFGCPGMEYEIAYPAELKEKIRAKIPDFDNALQWKGDDPTDPKTFAEAMACSRRSFAMTLELVELVTQEYPWDVMLVQIHQFDVMLHKLWQVITREGREKYPETRRPLEDLVGEMDSLFGKLAATAGGEDDLVLLVSDHGHGTLEMKFKPNNLLRDWGYLRRQGPLAHLKKHIRKRIGKLLNKKHFFAKGPRNLAERLYLNWEKTRAAAVMTGQDVFVYLNVRDRQPGGVVEPGKEYDDLIAELKRRFEAVRDPRQGKPVFKRIVTSRELYGIEDPVESGFPDLVLVCANGVYPIRSIQGRQAFKYARDGNLGGCHRPEGMFVMQGRPFKAGERFDAHIEDILPTVYAALGIDVPSYFDGKVMMQAFREAPEIHYVQMEASRTDPRPHADKSATSRENEDEDDVVKQRLSNLGYLE